MHTAPHCQPKLVFMSCAKQYEIQVGTPTSSYKFNELWGHINEAGDGNHDINYEDIDFIKAREATNDAKEANNYFRRLIEHARTLYRPDDLVATQDDPMTVLPRTVQWPAIAGERDKLAFTPGLMAKVFHRAGPPLLPNPANVLGGTGVVMSKPTIQAMAIPQHDLTTIGGSPLVEFSYRQGVQTQRQELAYPRSHFFLPRQYRAPFHNNAVSTGELCLLGCLRPAHVREPRRLGQPCHRRPTPT